MKVVKRIYNKWERQMFNILGTGHKLTQQIQGSILAHVVLSEVSQRRDRVTKSTCWMRTWNVEQCKCNRPTPLTLVPEQNLIHILKKTLLYTVEYDKYFELFVLPHHEGLLSSLRALTVPLMVSFTSAIKKSTFFFLKTSNCCRKTALTSASPLPLKYEGVWLTPPATRASPSSATFFAMSQAASFTFWP